MKLTTDFEILDKRWIGLFKFGSRAALIIAILLICEIFVYALIPNQDTPQEIFSLFKKNPLAGLLFFDLLGMIAYLFYIPLVLSFYVLLRKSNEAIMAIATFLFFVGVAVFFSCNTGFSILNLSHQYEIAKTNEERAILLATCKTMISLFDVNAFLVSYVIVSLAWTMISYVMLRSNLFSRLNSYVGIFAGLSGIIAEIIENALSEFLYVAIAFYFLAILFLIIWVVLSGKRLYQLHISLSNTNS